MTRYNPASNSPDWGGNTTRGWRRWERAARHALRRPMTDAAAVYRSRVDLALTVATAHRAVGDTKDGPWQFMGPRARMIDGKWETNRVRMYSTCSTYCTVLQITLDFNARSLEEVANAFAIKGSANQPHQRSVERLDVKTLRKGGIHCYVCTRKIGK